MHLAVAGTAAWPGDGQPVCGLHGAPTLAKQAHTQRLIHTHTQAHTHTGSHTEHGAHSVHTVHTQQTGRHGKRPCLGDRRRVKGKERRRATEGDYRIRRTANELTTEANTSSSSGQKVAKLSLSLPPLRVLPRWSLGCVSCRCVQSRHSISQPAAPALALVSRPAHCTPTASNRIFLGVSSGLQKPAESALKG